MGKIKQYKGINNRTEFFYYAFRNILLVSLPLLIVSGLVLSHLSFHSSATNSGTDNLAITISSSCTLGSVVNTPHSKEVYNGNYETNIGKTTIKTLCNDGNGYSIYANGYSNDEEGNNKLINSTYPQYSINTGLATNGLTSQWAMKLNNIENDPSPTPPSIDSSYNDTYGLVPNTWTKVAYRQSGTTDMSEGSSFTTTYSVYASSSQYAGTYVGQVKYLLTHPYSNNQYLGFDEAFAADNKNIITIDGNSYYAMQDMNSAICNAVKLMGEVSATQLVDIRDNKLYWIAKLADGHCWMTQNLDFDIVANEQDPTKMKTLTSEDTGLTDHSLIGAYADGYSYNPATGIISWTPASSAKAINFSGDSASGWTDSATVPSSANKTDDDGTGHKSLGNYYNWTMAIASNNSGNLTSDTINNIQNNPQNSICPKGWRLPTISNQSGATAGSTNEFTRLNYLYNNSSTTAGLVIAPLWLLNKGGILGGEGRISYYNQGLYWSSSYNNGTNAYQARIGEMDFASSRDRKRGVMIRCLARTED